MMFLFKTPRFRNALTGQMDGGQLHSGSELRVRYGEKLRTEKVETISGMNFRRIERVGDDKSRLRIWPRGEVRKATGHKGSSSEYVTTEATAAGVKAVLRRVRPEEEAEITALDQRISDAEQVLRDLRTERETLVRKAWTRAHVVRLNDVLNRIEEER